MGTIKSFKKFIEESIWSDMQDRSAGVTKRKEDDVNLLDYDSLYDYIKSKYSGKLFYIDKDYFGLGGETMCVDPIKNVSLYLKRLRDGSLEHILLSWTIVDIDHSFFLKLEERFFVSSPNVMRRIIKEKDGTCTNQTYIDLIDFFLEHIDNIVVNESIWSDMQDRSAGDTVRKEDEYDIDEKELERSVDTCIKTYVIGFIYYDKYDGSSDTFLKCIQEWNRNICQNAQLYDRRFGKYVEPIKVIPSYVKKNWETGKSYKSLVDKKMSEEEKKVKDTGFIKKPGESISDTLSKWFDENFEKLGDDFCEEIEEYNERYHNEGGSMSVDLDVEDWWDNLEYIEQVEIYQDYMKKTNESIWSDMQDRSAGDTVRKEDERHKILERLLATYVKLFAHSCRSQDDYRYFSYRVFISYIKDFRDNPRIEEVCPDDSYIDDLLDYVNVEIWDNQIYDTIKKINHRIDKGEHIITDDVIKELRKHNVNESIWSDIQDRSSGDVVRKEDEMTSDDYINLKEVLKMFGCEVRFFGINKNQKFFPVNAKTYDITLEDCLYFIDVLANGKFTGVDFSKLKKYIEANWEQDPMIKNIIQWTVDGENNKGIDRKIRNSVKREKTWDLYECDGVPGGLTPADVGGMGPAYFPGPNGEPGSGDLPSPTGIVYKQVAPFDSFIKIRKQKKKKKKFRKEDEPCAHSPNAKVYDYVDDFRDYVDRTYNNINKRK